MEALAAVSLAGNILQFVETIQNIISSARQLSHLGAKEEHLEIGILTRELQAWVLRVTPQDILKDEVLSEDERAIRKLGVKCNQIARELLEVLDTLKTKNKDGSYGRIEGLYKALLSEWKRGEIEELYARLDRIGGDIQKFLARYDTRKVLQRLSDLEKANQRLDAHRAVEIEGLRKQFDEIFYKMEDKLREAQSRDNTMKMLLDAAAEGSGYSAEQMILENLRFDAINDRYDGIRDAHEHSLKWLFNTGEQHSPATFDDWLISDDNLYWISGKPGSGKSTLMKFLCNHKRTIEQLNSWANQKPLIHARYFFWSSGKQKLQKSQEGLLRSLVYQILRQCPDMIPHVYPNIWALYFLEDRHRAQLATIAEGSSVSIPLDITGLLTALRTICDLAAISEMKFCFFIDGLDEYEGNSNDVIDLIRHLRTIRNAKLCLSSRSWNEFEQEFGKDRTQKLYMQVFNRDDISAYVHQTFVKDENYQELEDRDTTGNALIEEIVSAANGVFLWVFLVVGSFQEGLRNGDRISDLKRRLQTLPTDLNDYFERILLSDVTEFYRGQFAEMFLVTLEAAADLPLIAYNFMGEDPDYVMKLQVKPLPPQQLYKRLKVTKKRLNACCKGLLEVQDFLPDGKQTALPSSILFDWKVNFLHRSVRDFLLLEDTATMLRRWRSSGFDPHETICKALLALIKVAPVPQEYWDNDGPISGLYQNFNFHFRLQTCGNQQATKMREEFDAILKLRRATFIENGDTLDDVEKRSEGGQTDSIQQERTVQYTDTNKEHQGGFRNSLGIFHKKLSRK